MKIKKILGFLVCFGIFNLAVSFANANEEKTMSFEDKAQQVNKELFYLKQELKERYERAPLLYQKQADQTAFFKLMKEIQQLRDKKEKVENHFHEFLLDKNQSEEAYAFWDQGETTLGQLIMEYGSGDFLYIIPAEIANIKLNMYSALAIPHENFEEIIEMILTQNGIGVKKLASYLRQLFILKQNPGFVEHIASDKEMLKFIPDTSLLFYLLAPPVDELHSVLAFLEKFSDPKEMTLQIVGSKIALVAMKKNVESLLTLYEAAYGDSEGKNYQVYNLTKLKVEEGERIVKALFADTTFNRSRPPFMSMRNEEIQIIPLREKNALVFLGEDAKVKRAFDLLDQLEGKLSEGEENIFFWYTCQHSDPQEIADLLSKLFSQKAANLNQLSITKKNEERSRESLSVNPAFVRPGTIEKSIPSEIGNSIVVDPKTSSILMIIKKEEAKSLETVLKRIDVPKRMVQIDVLLVERTLRDSKQTGINLLKIGSSANNKTKTEIEFDASDQSSRRGILDFIYSHSKGYLPSFDLAMSFLLAQEDVKINANPSILAVNQTPAKISLGEEFSINTGAVRVEGSKNVEKSYTRVQYGTTIVITPTIHLPENEGEKGYVTLQTNINFDTPQQNTRDDRPPVTRRHIENEVCIADGETIILGGLRRKAEEDNREKIPFLGDLPGIGKLFGSTKLIDNSTEMFIFITPKIIKDPREALSSEREKALQKRPGDIPEFLAKLEEAKKKEKKRLFEDSLKVLFENF